MKIRKIHTELERLVGEGKKMFVTSSFQTQSLVLLHIVSKCCPDVPVYFLDTGYHFPETIVHKNFVASQLGLRVVDLRSSVPKSMQRNEQGNLLFTFDPDYCCYVNKVQPLEPLLEYYDVWISGVRADQNQHRSKLSRFEKTTGGTVRYHPMLDWTALEINAYIAKHGLPVHPLEYKGYGSIGCEPCTRLVLSSDLRDGRWYGMKKQECGLNSDTLQCRK